jgi:phenylpyruvate tautomerase PptA (4-oxalocrotonate tautomerase family)
MPSYVCTTVPGRLSGEQRARIAAVLTDVHHRTTAAPAYFVRVAFEEVAADAVYIGGAPLQHDHLFVFGHIRAGRDAATRRRLIDAISAGVRDAAGLHHLGLWVYLAELPEDNMVEFGHGLPPSGREAVWRDALPADDRTWMESLAG